MRDILDLEKNQEVKLINITSLAPKLMQRKPFL